MSTWFILMSKFLIVSSFFVLTPLLLFTSIFYSLYLLNNQNYNRLSYAPPHAVAFAALPSLGNVIQDQIAQEDARVEIVKQFFERYKSPLEPFATSVVETADMYGIDFRLIPAIAMQESNLCKKAPEDSYNCWGFGIYGQKVTRFSDYEEAIAAVTKTLSSKYIADGLDTPQKIMRRYTPRSNGSWADSVEYFMNQLQ